MAQRDLTQGSVPLSLFKLTAPMSLGIAASILVQTLEMGFIGQLGTEYVAAMTFTFPLTMILSSLALGIGIGASSIIARSVGGGDQSDVRRLGTHSMLLVGIAMTLLACIGWATIDPVFMALGAPPEMLPLLHSYLDIYYPGAVLFNRHHDGQQCHAGCGQCQHTGAGDDAWRRRTPRHRPDPDLRVVRHAKARIGRRGYRR